MMQVSPLLVTLAALTGPDDARREQALRNIDGPGEWQSLFQLAKRHRVGALLAAAASKAEGKIDGYLAARLARTRLKTHRRSIRSAETLHEIADALGHTGTWAMLLKGGAVAHDLYHEPKDRLSVDIDLLVAKEDLGCLHMFEKLGFQFADFPSLPIQIPGADFLRLAPDIALHRPSDGALVELHWRLSRNRELPNWPIEFIRQSSDTRTIGKNGPQMPVFQPVAQLVYLACHGARHSWFRLKWMGDFDRLCRSLSPAAMENACALADRSGCGRLLHSSMALAQMVCATPLPAAHQPEQVDPVVLKGMISAISDEAALGARFGIGRIAPAWRTAHGRWRLRGGSAYRRNLLRGYALDPVDFPEWIEGKQVSGPEILRGIWRKARRIRK